MMANVCTWRSKSVATPTVEPEQSLLPLSPEAPIDLVHEFVNPEGLIYKQNPRPNLALRRSVKDWGVMKPILVHRSYAPDAVDGKPVPALVVVDGNRRVGAALEAGIHVHAMITSDLGYLKSVATIMLNETGDKNPLAVMEALDELIDAGYSESDIAAKTGMSVATVRKRLKLRKIVPEIRSKMADGKVAPGIAERIAKLTPTEQIALYNAAYPDAPDATVVPITAESIRNMRSVGTQATLSKLPSGFFNDPQESSEPETNHLIEMSRRITQLREWLSEVGIPVKTFVAEFNKAGRAKSK